jgi:hypothetical protein
MELLWSVTDGRIDLGGDLVVGRETEDFITYYYWVSGLFNLGVDDEVKIDS